MTQWALLGDYPITRALKSGEVPSSLRFADVKVPNTAFKRVVRNLEFDVAELAIVTFLLARAHGRPLRLLPAVLTARFQHPLLVCDAANRMLAPKDLEGRRVGVRSYSVTTAVWIRAILADDFGVDIDRVTWVALDEPHVAEYRDPPNVERAAAGNDVTAMLLGGEVDAAILGESPANERLVAMIPDPASAAQRWRMKNGAIQINHMLTVKDTVSADDAREVLDALKRSRDKASDLEMNPFGLEENRRNLEVAIDCVYRQKMIPRRFTVDELFQ